MRYGSPHQGRLPGVVLDADEAQECEETVPGLYPQRLSYSRVVELGRVDAVELQLDAPVVVGAIRSSLRSAR